MVSILDAQTQTHTREKEVSKDLLQCILYLFTNEMATQIHYGRSMDLFYSFCFESAIQTLLTIQQCNRLFLDILLLSYKLDILCEV